MTDMQTSLTGTFCSLRSSGSLDRLMMYEHVSGWSM